jgi:hypothetical protein
MLGCGSMVIASQAFSRAEFKASLMSTIADAKRMETHSRVDKEEKTQRMPSVEFLRWSHAEIGWLLHGRHSESSSRGCEVFPKVLVGAFFAFLKRNRQVVETTERIRSRWEGMNCNDSNGRKTRMFQIGTSKSVWKA